MCQKLIPILWRSHRCQAVDEKTSTCGNTPLRPLYRLILYARSDPALPLRHVRRQQGHQLKLQPQVSAPSSAAPPRNVWRRWIWRQADRRARVLVRQEFYRGEIRRHGERRVQEGMAPQVVLFQPRVRQGGECTEPSVALRREGVCNLHNTLLEDFRRRCVSGGDTAEAAAVPHGHPSIPTRGEENVEATWKSSGGARDWLHAKSPFHLVAICDRARAYPNPECRRSSTSSRRRSAQRQTKASPRASGRSQTASWPASSCSTSCLATPSGSSPRLSSMIKSASSFPAGTLYPPPSTHRPSTLWQAGC